MDSLTSRLSDISLVSLGPEEDPGLVPRRKKRQGSSSSGPESVTRDETTNVPAKTAAHDGATREKHSKKTARGQQNSLRHVKNSTDLLRQRSLNGPKAEVASDGSSGGREGRQFTVGNVGTNGLIYLRPVVNAAHQKQQAPFVFPPITPPLTAHLKQSEPEKDMEEGLRHSVWSDSQWSEIPKRQSYRVNRNTPTDITTTRQSHTRAQSFSTVEGSQTSSTLKPGVFRIVIDRSDSTKRPQTAEQSGLPTLEVPIPHYRLGTPRFSEQGTPALRSSAYTRTSVSDNFRSSTLPRAEYEKFPVPPGLGSTEMLPNAVNPSKGGLQPSAIRTTGMSGVSGVTRSSAALPSPVFYKVQEPIEPIIFDDLAAHMNDPSVVRLSPQTGEITAASPARIVAQISSESFMDYELVSDFFLTFRSYLSPHNLLGLLLARLHWAINRLEADGRIIRIRTFAALRHWILNYFVDDFAVNRDLRILFCDKINEMYREVKRRVGGGHSDLKILLDLKRCWNGRCSLYWDSTSDMTVNGHPDAEIKPGGVVGSRDSQLSRLPITPPEATASILVHSVSGEEEPRTAIQTWFGSIPGAQAQAHDRQQSIDSVEMPVSPVSDQSMQVISCSFPAKGFGRSPSPSRSPGPHPVLVPIFTAASSPPTASLAGAARRRPIHTHKRSGSFSDSARDDRAPLPATSKNKQQQTIVMAFPHAGSLIRGNLYPPAPPYIDVLAPISPRGPNGHFDLVPEDASNFGDGNLRANALGNNGYRSLFGSIRRALSSRQSGSHNSIPAVGSGPSGPSIRGKTSTLPLNVAYHADAPTRERRAAHGTRSQMRIDLLCAEVAHTYKSVTRGQDEDFRQSQYGIGLALGNEREQPSPAFGDASLAADMGRQRFPSLVTAGSKSIVIVDDTGLDMPDIPAMSGALDHAQLTEDVVAMQERQYSSLRQEVAWEEHPPPARGSKSSIRSEHRSSSLDRGSFDRKNTLRRRESSRIHSRDGSFHFGRTQSTNQSKRAISEGPSSSVLRKHASFQSGMSRQGTKLGVGNDPTMSGPREVSSGDVFDSMPARLLRRRPGGDLRKIQNVHDLEPTARRQSAGSAATYSDSAGGSVLFMAKNRYAVTSQPYSSMSADVQKSRTPTLSLIRTHSSQHMRPSFEAAVAGFSAIPDDEDGGIEATLLRLEGKYQKPTPPLKAEATITEPESFDDNLVTDIANQQEQRESIDKRKHRHKKVAQDGISETPEPFQDSGERASPASDQPQLSYSAIPNHPSPIFGLATASIADSEDSYSSIPLLERGLSQEMRKKSKPSPVRSDVSVPRPLFSRNASENNPKADSSHPSIEVVEETESMKRIPQGSTLPQKSPTTESFLLDEDENLTDLSSEISVEFVDASEAMDHPLNSTSSRLRRTAVLGIDNPRDGGRHPPSPPTTMDNPLSSASQVNPGAFQHRPLTPDPSPTTKSAPFDGARGDGSQLRAETPTPIPRGGATPVPSPGHLPFILACDSETLAQQLTIVEKSALTEVDWRDLVDMRWTTRSPAFLNWVQFLTSQEHRGVDLVIARFNLVVKWALSEVVMTKDIGERARTIVKYIHVAAHCRRLRNYATMLQLTIALTSVDCTRLVKTWELVPPTEKQTLRAMETLIQPIRNFHDLRVEMESVDLQDGCIPFVGLYVHDLTYNSQKPAQIASTRDGDPLVNFERYRRAATVVKGLLRLIDSSSKYTFQPVEGVLERCLWLATLPDEKIQAMSQGLE